MPTNAIERPAAVLIQFNETVSPLQLGLERLVSSCLRVDHDLARLLAIAEENDLDSQVVAA